MKNELLTKGIILPSGEIGKDKINWSCQEWFSPKMQGSPGATWLHQAAGVWCAL